MLLGADDGLVNGNLNLADILFLAAFIVAVVVAVIRFIAHSVDGALMAVAVALITLGWLVL